VIVTDGVITAASRRRVQARVKQLPGVERVDVVLAGGSATSAPQLLVHAGLPRTGAVLDLDRDLGTTPSRPRSGRRWRPTSRSTCPSDVRLPSHDRERARRRR
jgi:hypothetical protein